MIEEALARHAALVESVLAQVLTKTPLDGEIARPERLMAAMRHGVLAGGKRLRPFLVIETARLFGVDPAEAV
ncbi:MAG: polyprenyl synthetase family protein, partial [Alphaproteobacteria bacterium]